MSATHIKRFPIYLSPPGADPEPEQLGIVTWILALLVRQAGGSLTVSDLPNVSLEEFCLEYDDALALPGGSVCFRLVPLAEENNK